ncbi:MAG: PTS transporter subunit EIIA [Xanthomonadaceae bacterium]|nr:PTS transporter subunit EIIA [Xanthomonadaceae bacterium]
MKITDLLTKERIRVVSDVTSKKKALEIMSEMLADEAGGIPAAAVLNRLIGRERLGSTGLGHGVALPHARLERLQEARGGFLRLTQGVEFDAFDRQPVDLLFALVVPEHFTDEHLQILADLAEMFSDQELCQRLRQPIEPDAIFQNLLAWEAARSS